MKPVGYASMRRNAIHLRHKQRRILLTVLAIVSACAATWLLFIAGIAALLGESVWPFVPAVPACGAITVQTWRRP